MVYTRQYFCFACLAARYLLLLLKSSNRLGILYFLYPRNSLILRLIFLKTAKNFYSLGFANTTTATNTTTTTTTTTTTISINF